MTDRPGFAEMLERLMSNGARTIVVESPDRFARDLGLDPTVVSPAAISEKPPDSWLSRSKDTIEASTFDISPVETGASLGAGARNAVTRGPSLLTKWVFCQKSGSLAA